MRPNVFFITAFSLLTAFVYLAMMIYLPCSAHVSHRHKMLENDVNNLTGHVVVLCII